MQAMAVYSIDHPALQREQRRATGRSMLLVAPWVLVPTAGAVLARHDPGLCGFFLGWAAIFLALTWRQLGRVRAARRVLVPLYRSPIELVVTPDGFAITGDQVRREAGLRWVASVRERDDVFEIILRDRPGQPWIVPVEPLSEAERACLRGWRERLPAKAGAAR
jgi:hypothetical protein